jgi:hypothetical protein
MQLKFLWNRKKESSALKKSKILRSPLFDLISLFYKKKRLISRKVGRFLFICHGPELVTCPPSCKEGRESEQLAKQHKMITIGPDGSGLSPRAGHIATPTNTGVPLGEKRKEMLLKELTAMKA